MLTVWVVAALSVQTPSPLAELEAEYSKYSKPPTLDVVRLQELNQKVFSLVEKNQLKTGDELLRASEIIATFRFRMSVSREKHELCLVALASGNPKARTAIKASWDGLMLSVGRRQRIGTIKVPGQDRFDVAPTPKSIRAVFLDPDQALSKAAASTTDAEATKLCADDQAARNVDWAKLTQKQLSDINAQDILRKKRMGTLLAKGRIVNQDDFDHASLVFQHGDTWDDYCIAHELSVCSLLLGRKEAAWLAAASYDRMLVSAGYPQRFGTQYSSELNGPVQIDPFDTSGIGDTMRQMMHCPTLEEAKNRKWN